MVSIPKFQDYKSTEQYDLKKKVWNVLKDVHDNDFKPLVNQVVYYIWKDIPDEDQFFYYVWEDIETKLSREIKSFLITARAGAGKSYLIKQF